MRSLVRNGARLVVFVVVGLVAIPILWIVIAAVGEFAYGGGSLDNWWRGPLGLILHTGGTLIGAVIAGGLAVELLFHGRTP